MKQTSGGWFKACNAIIAGDVVIAADSSIWFAAVVRGDVAAIRIGQRTNVQDNAVVHCETDVPNIIEDDVVIGHGALVHGKFVGKGSLIGMGAIVLDRVHIGSQCLIAAGAVVPPGLEVPDRMCVMGVPGKIVRPVSDAELQYMQRLAEHYRELAAKHVAGVFAEME